MKTNSGWVRIYRSMSEKGWYQKSEYVHLWLHILLKATHKGTEFMFDGMNQKLKPGQFITGRKKLAQETGINESQIQRILDFFEKKEHQIEQQTTNKNRLITICNWEKYQSISFDEQQNEQQTNQQSTNNQPTTEQQLNNKRTTSEQQLNTYNNDKNINNNKKHKNIKEEKKENLYFKKLEKRFVKFYLEYPEIGTWYRMYIEFVKEKHKINYSEQYKYETYNLLCNAAGGDAYKVLGLLQNAVRNAQVLVPPHEFADN